MRSNPEFAKIRHDIWSLLREEVAKAQELERNKQLAGNSKKEVTIHG